MKRVLIIGALALFIACTPTKGVQPSTPEQPKSFTPFTSVITIPVETAEPTPAPTRPTVKIPKPKVHVESKVKPTPAPKPQPKPVAAPKSAAKAYAFSRLGSTQYACIDALFTRESNWRYNALNKYSGAYGIPQALPGSKMRSAGADWKTNPITQVKWGIGYVNGRYGSACGAWRFWQSHHWY